MLKRHYGLLAAATLALAAFNLTFRLGHEFVTEWDESLYAISAWEALRNHAWIGTTFLGQLDYYNTKPPLMLWLIAASFKLFGVSLWSLRLASVVCAWLTVFVMQRWTKRVFGPAVAIATTVVLSTTFGFIYIHSGRFAVTDAPFTLVVALTALVAYDTADRPVRQIWLGPLFAAAFMLRGMGVVMPAAIVGLVVLLERRRWQWNWRAIAAAVLLFVVPVGAWAWARYRVDQWSFLGPLFMYDFVARTVETIEEHPGGPFFYLNILQKSHYDWLIAGVAALWTCPVRWREVVRHPTATHLRVVLLAWIAVTLLMPTLMQTKLPWYLNTFYPVFALGVGALIARPFVPTPSKRDWRRVAAIALIVIAFGVAEGKLIWYSYQNRDLRRSEQALLIEYRDRLRGHRVFDETGTRASHFVAEAVVGADPVSVTRPEFVAKSGSGDFLLTAERCDLPGVQLVRATGDRYLYFRR